MFNIFKTSSLVYVPSTILLTFFYTPTSQKPLIYFPCCSLNVFNFTFIFFLSSSCYFILDEQGTREAISDDESSPFSKGNTATLSFFFLLFSPLFNFFLCVSQLKTRVILAGAAEKYLD